jgi:UDP-glucose 4-epimerase
VSKILVTGGAGYIGSHTIVELLEEGFDVVVLDNLSNSSSLSLNRIQSITGNRPMFIEGDIRDSAVLDKVFTSNRIDAVIHFAGLKAIGNSVERPLEYYDNNVNGSIKLLTSMREHNIKKIIFSSSAAVYGHPSTLPINEEMPLGIPTNPYGMTKLMIENILGDICSSDPEWRIARLRYFNPVGAHASGLIGEDPRSMPNNLMPLIAQTAFGKLPQLSVFGDDYPTADGSAIRDYIHVVDLAKGHLAALQKCETQPGLHTFNLGTGRGHSVLEMIRTFEKVNRVKVPYTIKGRRAGDVAACYADTSLATDSLGWVAKLSIENMCHDTWNWQKKNPNGFR